MQNYDGAPILAVAIVLKTILGELCVQKTVLLTKL